jgi:hypothetical protein
MSKGDRFETVAERKQRRRLLTEDGMSRSAGGTCVKRRLRDATISFDLRMGAQAECERPAENELRQLLVQVKFDYWFGKD